MDYQTWYDMMTKNNIKASSMKEIADDWLTNDKEWYHLLGNINDVDFLTNLPSLKFYSICRCHLIANDESTAHEHFHGLVHFIDDKKANLKRRLIRCGIKLNGKTTFKSIFCLDHVVGVLRYICCEDGQKLTRRDDDGLMGRPHTHYSRMVFDQKWLHPRGKYCGEIRNDISGRIADCFATFPEKFLSKLELHDFEKCLCDRGKMGKEKKKMVNLKRREFYKTEKGLEVKERYRQKAACKRKLLEELSQIKLNKKAELSRETIQKLLSYL